jgi:hypothetical protein
VYNNLTDSTGTSNRTLATLILRDFLGPTLVCFAKESVHNILVPACRSEYIILFFIICYICLLSGFFLNPCFAHICNCCYPYKVVLCGYKSYPLWPTGVTNIFLLSVSCRMLFYSSEEQSCMCGRSDAP